jgi:hypothetical protein
MTLTRNNEPLQIRRSVPIRIDLLHTVFPASAGSAETKEGQGSCSAEFGGAECPLCHMQVSSGELRQLSEIEADSVPKDPLLRRLQSGQCIRQTCSSCLYDVSILLNSEADWPAIERRILLVAAAAELSKVSEPAGLPKRTRLLIGIACLLLAAIAFSLVQHWVFGYPIPLLQKRRTFPAGNAGQTDAGDSSERGAK